MICYNQLKKAKVVFVYTKMNQSTKKGFTLIELLVVVAVIGILASVILVGLASFRGRGRDARRIGDLRQVQNGLELYFTANGAYPGAADWASLSADLTGAGLGINQVPNDPTPGSNYGYCSNATGDRYTLSAALEENSNEVTDIVPDCVPAGFSCGPAGGTNYCVTI